MTNRLFLRLRAFAPSPTLMLVAVTALWGLSFPLMKNWQDAAKDCPGGKLVASFTLIALRMVLALFTLGLLRPRLFLDPSRREYQIGFLLGAAFFAGFALQVVGLASTTPALSAFITSLGSAWVPLLAWAWFGMAVSGLTALGLALGLAGTFILSISNPEEGSGWGGEWLTLLSSVVFAIDILLLDRMGRTVNSAHLTVAFMAITAVLALLLAAICAAYQIGLPRWLDWTVVMLHDASILRTLGLLTLFSTVLAFHWMNVYQPRVSAGRAALIYLLEPVFGAAFSILWGHDPLTGWLFLGGGLILIGNLLVELPRWLRNGPKT